MTYTLVQGMLSTHGAHVSLGLSTDCIPNCTAPEGSGPSANIWKPLDFFSRDIEKGEVVLLSPIDNHFFGFYRVSPYYYTVVSAPSLRISRQHHPQLSPFPPFYNTSILGRERKAFQHIAPGRSIDRQRTQEFQGGTEQK